MQEEFRNPNDVTKQHAYATHVLAGLLRRYFYSLMLACSARDFLTNTPSTADMYNRVAGPDSLRSLEAYRNIATQVSLDQFDEEVIELVDKMIDEMRAASNLKPIPRVSKEEYLNGKTHVDEWIEDTPYTDPPGVRHAKFFLMQQRLNATILSHYESTINKLMKVFVTYEGVRYRCIGASRMGDVWLTTKFDHENGYEKRVMVDDCSDWSDTP